MKVPVFMSLLRWRKIYHLSSCLAPRSGVSFLGVETPSSQSQQRALSGLVELIVLSLKRVIG